MEDQSNLDFCSLVSINVRCLCSESLRSGPTSNYQQLMKAMNLSFESPHTGGLDSAGSLVCYSDFMFHCSMVTWEMERKSWLTADICFLCSLCLSFTYNLPFFSHSKYQYLDVVVFFVIFLIFLSYSFCFSFSQLAVFRSLLFTSAEEQVQRSMVNNFRVQQALKGRTVRSSFSPFLQDDPPIE